MRRIVSIAVVALAAWGVFSARGNMQPPKPQQSQQGEKKLVDIKADVMGNVAHGDSVVFLVGNFAAHHNGAVITCDSAVRYSETYIECFGNVLINKNTTYIYGDRADYDGDKNMARVYSDIVKVIDGDATLYTHEFFFDTKDNIGEFNGGGVMTNRESVLEAVHGFYYADNKELVAVDQVEMRNDEYELRGDSVVYNTESDNAQFFERTNIWSREGDYLYADRGQYIKADTLYKVTRNGYVLTEKQEMWSDSIDYYRSKEHVKLWRDIQIDDTEHKVLAFGDYGEYWKEPGNALLTRRPSAISYDLSQGDSVFMRSDSMFLYTINKNREEAEKAAVAAKAAVVIESGDAQSEAAPTTIRGGRPSGGSIAETLEHRGKLPTEGQALVVAEPEFESDTDTDSGESAAPAVVDSLATDSVAIAPPAVAPTKEELKAAAQKAKAEKKIAAAKAKKEKLAEIAHKRQEKTTAKLLAQKEREEARLANARLKAESKLRARQARAERKGKIFEPDSTALKELDSLLDRTSMEKDSLLLSLADSLAADSLSMAIPADSLDSLDVAPADSIYRLIKAYRNVRIFRSDFQAVCDSLTAISTDSTMHMYIEPVLWNEANQITSEVMDFFTLNQQIVRAEFVGSPMMVTMLDTLHYNQIAGKQMTAHFRDNEIYRNDVNGNVQTIYYMEDGEPAEVTGVFVVESGDASFYIEEKQVVNIVYRNNITDNGFPMDKIPDTQELFLRGFKWEGERRPSQGDVFDRQIRSSEREVKSELPHPQFPIKQRMDEQRKSLIERRRWTDRSEKVDILTVEWMRSLGYEVGQPRESNGKKK